MADEQFIIGIRALCSAEGPDALPFIGSVFCITKHRNTQEAGIWGAATHVRNHLKQLCT